MEYSTKSCNTLQKVYYTPVEAALRWCNLTAHEAVILESMRGEYLPPVGMFQQWPCLRLNTERIVDAMEHGEIPVGRDGATMPPGEQIAKPRRTIRHTDLAAWMAENWTGSIPTFLQDSEPKKEGETLGTKERNTLLAIIAALCSEAKIDHTKPAKAAGQIVNIMASMGVSVGETTIEGHLKKIPDALESRTK